MRIQPQNCGFAAILTDIDLTLRGADIPSADIWRAMSEYPVCVIRTDYIATDEDQIALSRSLGDVDVRPTVGRFAGREHLSPHPEIIDGASNIDKNGNILPADDMLRLYARGNMLWHTDSSFKKPRALFSLLSARIVPPVGGQTEFVDLRAAYDNLPQALKDKIENLEVNHSIWHSRVQAGYPDPTDEERAARPPVRQRLVELLPSGRKTLYLAAHAESIVGMSSEEGSELLAELMERATRPDGVYSHDWKAGDIVIWDNRCTMHRATPYESQKYPRDMRRTVVLDTALQAA